MTLPLSRVGDYQPQPEYYPDNFLERQTKQPPPSKEALEEQKTEKCVKCNCTAIKTDIFNRQLLSRLGVFSRIFSRY